MSDDDYQMQVLQAVAKGCKPNSPYPERAWLRVRPLCGTPEFGNALSSLVRRGLLERKHGFRVKPTLEGYAVIFEMKIRRRAKKARPPMFTRLIWDQTA